MSVALAPLHDWVKVIAVGEGEGVIRGRAAEYRHRGVALASRPSVLAALTEISRDPDAVVIVPTDLDEMPPAAFVALLAAMTRVRVIGGIAPGCSAEDLRDLLESGVDTTLRLPLRPATLAQALTAVQVQTAGTEHVLRCGDLVLDSREHRVVWRGRDVHLAPKEFEILRHLMQAHPGVVTIDRLVSTFERGDESRAIRVRSAVTRLRARFAESDPHAAGVVETVHRIGYRLALPVPAERPSDRR